MSIHEHPLGKQLLGVDNCPHCMTANPTLMSVWSSGNKPTARANKGPDNLWGVYLCTTCGSVVSARAFHGRDRGGHPFKVNAMYPMIWQASSVLPDMVRRYLEQAHKTLASFDASVVMSAASIDAMLKVHGFEKGSLYSRIDEAVKNGVLTITMAEWAHRVRLDSNNPRHADKDSPQMNEVDAQRAFGFANALAEFLFVLPSQMPPKPGAEGDETDDEGDQD